MNPFRTAYRFNGGEWTRSRCAGFPFTVKCVTTYSLAIPVWVALRNLFRGVGRYRIETEFAIDCDPELKAIIDDYTRRKALEPAPDTPNPPR